MKTLEYSFKLDKSDFQAISKAVLKHRTPKLFIIFIFAFNFLILLPLYILEAMDGFLLNSHLFVFCLEILLYTLTMYSLKVKSTTLYESSASYDSPMICKLHEDQIEYVTANSSGTQLYTELFSTVESKSFFLFFVSKGALISIPKNIVTTEEELQQIRAIMKKVPKRSKTKYEKKSRWVYFVIYLAMFLTIFMLLRSQG